MSFSCNVNCGPLPETICSEIHFCPKPTRKISMVLNDVMIFSLGKLQTFVPIKNKAFLVAVKIAYTLLYQYLNHLHAL